MTKPNFPNVQIFRMKMTLNGRLPKIAIFEYLSNHWSVLSQILNYGLDDQNQAFLLFKIFQMKMTLNRRLPQMEDYLK